MLTTYNNKKILIYFSNLNLKIYVSMNLESEVHSKFKIKKIQFPQSFSVIASSPKCSKLMTKKKRLRTKVEFNGKDQW